MSNAAPDTQEASLVLIGPPTGESLETLLRGHSGPVFLVEPDPDRAALIDQDFGHRDGVSVLAVAVESDPGPAELSEFNFPGLRSTRRPTPELTELFPGLRVRARHTVERITPAQLLERLGDVPRPLYLQIDAPGAELGILQGWQEAGALDRLDRVHLRCGASAMFEGGSDLLAIRTWADANGFRVTAEDLRDPDWPELTLAPDRMVQQLTQARAELAQKVRLIEAQGNQIEELKTCIDELMAAREDLARQSDTQQKRIAELEAWSASLKQTLNAKTAEIATLSKARDTAVAGAQAEAEGFRKRLAEVEAHAAKVQQEQQARIAELEGWSKSLETDLEAKTAEIEALTETGAREFEERLAEAEANAAKVQQEQQARIAELEGWSKSLETDLEAKTAEIEALTETGAREFEERLAEAEANAAKAQQERIAELEQTVADLNATHESLVGRLDEARSDMATALRLQALAQSDLSELQERYRQSEKTRLAQTDLLRKLTPRLQVAAQQLQQMTALSPDSAEEQDALAAPGAATTTGSPRENTSTSSTSGSKAQATK